MEPEVRIKALCKWKLYISFTERFWINPNPKLLGFGTDLVLGSPIDVLYKMQIKIHSLPQYEVEKYKI